MITAGTFGAPNWVDLATPDVEAATALYSCLFGWEIEKTASPMGDYFIGKIAGQQVAGMMEQTPDMSGMPAMWTTFFFVEDLDETVKRVEAAGGAILQKPFAIPDGRVAVAADPTGAMFGLITWPAPEGVWLSREPGAVSWVETLTRDPAASEGFYTVVFDWKAETQDTGVTRYTTFMLDGDPVAGMMVMPDTVPADAPAHWSVYFTVAECEPVVKLAMELGAEVLTPIMEIEIGRFAVLEDPQGAVFELMEYSD